MSHKNNLYKSPQGSRVICTHDDGKQVRLVIERPGKEGCEERYMSVTDFEKLGLTFVRNGKYVI